MSCESPVRDQLSGADSSSAGDAREERFPSSRHLKWIVTVLLVYFGLRLLYFATGISHYLPPDEVSHFGMSKIFSAVFLLPDNSPATYAYGLVTNSPWLYYWLMGKLLHLNFFGAPDLLFLRLLNIPLAFGTVYFVWRMLRLLTDDRLPQILLIAAMTNTLMFSFLSASVSYDNLTNLLAAMAVYYLLAFFKNRSGSLLAASILCQLAGCLTKTTFLPLVLALNVLLLIHEFRNLRLLPNALSAWFKAEARRGIVLTLAILVGLALNLQLYGGNYLRYGSLEPKMSQVLSLDIAMQHRTQARNEIFTLFREGRVSKEEALAMTERITHPGDQNDAVVLIENYARTLNSGYKMLSPPAYVALWMLHMSGTIFGIKAHIGMENLGITFLPLAVLILLAGAAFLIRWRPRDAGGLSTCMAAIAAFYAIFLIYFVNYETYLYFRNIFIGMAGRYLFPVIGPIYVLSSFYLLRLFRGRNAQLAISLFAALIFLVSDFPFFLSHVTPEWFAALPK